MQKCNGAESEAEFPPQICGLGHPPDVRAARGVAHVNVSYLREGIEGCCPGHYIIHRKCPQLVGRLLNLVVGYMEGLVLRQGVGSRIGAGLQGGQLGQSLLGHGQKEGQMKALRAVGKRNSGEWGKFT